MKRILTVMAIAAAVARPAHAQERLPTPAQAAAVGLQIEWVANGEAFDPNAGMPHAAIWPDRTAQEAYIVLRIGSRVIAKIDARQRNVDYARWGLFDPKSQQVEPLGVEGMRRVADEIKRQYQVLGREVVAEEIVRPQTFIATASDKGAIELFDADSGVELWQAAVDRPGLPMFGPAMNDQFVAAINGSTLYVFDRANGRLINERPLQKTAATLPVVAADFVYVVGTDGSITAYQRDDLLFGVRSLRFTGSHLQPPAVSADQRFMVWPHGQYVYTASLAPQFELWSRLQARSEIATSPTLLSDGMLVAAQSGVVMRLDYNRNQNIVWRSNYGRELFARPLTNGSVAIVVSTSGYVGCIDVATGSILWDVLIPGVQRAVTISPDSVYLQDFNGGLIAAGLEDGRLLGRLEDNLAPAVLNDFSDRVYLRANDGRLMCLRPQSAAAPRYHPVVAAIRGTAAPTAAATEADASVSDAPGDGADLLGNEIVDEPAAMDGGAAENPFGGDNPFGGENPFGGAEANPFGGGGENPFGG